MSKNKIINISAAIITNQHHEILLVRKKGSSYFMQAGGKIEAGETPIDALVRELQEELRLALEPSIFNYIGHFIAPAANEANHDVSAHLFSITIVNAILTAHAELAEVGWYSLKQAQKLILAPLTKTIILPLLEKNKPAV